MYFGPLRKALDFLRFRGCAAEDSPCPTGCLHSPAGRDLSMHAKTLTKLRQGSYRQFVFCGYWPLFPKCRSVSNADFNFRFAKFDRRPRGQDFDERFAAFRDPNGLPGFTHELDNFEAGLTELGDRDLFHISPLVFIGQFA
jgi:hypothetical protein